jgi:germination protein M
VRSPFPGDGRLRDPQAKETPVKALLLVPAAVICAALGFAAASCGSDDATSAGPVPSVTEPVAGSTETGAATLTAPPPTTEGEATGTGETPDPAPITYQVWFNDAEGLFVTYRTEAGTPRVGTAALRSLLAGPNDFERGYGLTTAVPQGTRLLGLSIEDGIASVDLTSEFESGGGSLSMQARLAQVVYTLTQFRTVKGVLLSLDGEPVNVIGGEGVLVDRPLRRKDFADLLPAILVTSPALVQRIDNPVVVSGSANVFEANVTVAVLDSSGREIASTFTTATCGTGCRGTYSVAVPYKADEEQEGTIVVHDDDAAGVGRPPHEVRIPVTLTPG